MAEGGKGMKWVQSSEGPPESEPHEKSTASDPPAEIASGRLGAGQGRAEWTGGGVRDEIEECAKSGWSRAPPPPGTSRTHR